MITARSCFYLKIVLTAAIIQTLSGFLCGKRRNFDIYWRTRRSLVRLGGLTPLKFEQVADLPSDPRSTDPRHVHVICATCARTVIGELPVVVCPRPVSSVSVFRCSHVTCYLKI